MFKLGLEKTEGPEITLATSVGPSKKVREFQKKSERNPAFDCVDHNKLWKVIKSWEYEST